MKDTLMQLEADGQTELERLWSENPINSVRIMSLRKNLDALSATIDLMEYVESLESIELSDFELVPSILEEHHMFDYGSDNAGLRL